MSWLEIAYVAAALVAAGMGGHAVGYAKGKIVERRQFRRHLHTALNKAWEQGFETADRFFNDERFAQPGESFENPYPLPNTNTKEKNQ